VITLFALKSLLRTWVTVDKLAWTQRFHSICGNFFAGLTHKTIFHYCK
jgi:hypothetical protein